MIKRQSKVVAKTSINWRPFYASQLAVLATWIMLQILFSIAAHAQALPPGTLVDVLGLNDESGIICSTYIKNKKTSYYLSKAAGGKLFGKRYIDATGLRIQIAAVKKDIASMTPRAKKDKKIKKGSGTARSP